MMKYWKLSAVAVSMSFGLALFCMGIRRAYSQPGISLGIGSTTSTIVVRKQTVLAGAAEVVTVQMPATAPVSGNRTVRFMSASVDCTVACNWTLERNGTAATTVSLTPLNVNPQELPPVTVAFNTSNVGAGSIIGSYTCAAACTPIPIDLTGIWFTSNPGGSQNLTLRSNSITGTVDIMIKYQEQNQ